MKILIVSDIHGSLDAAKRIVDLASSYDMVFCLGDVLYHGPRNDLPASYAPKSVIPLMNSLSDRMLAVRGNCEAEVDQMVLAFPVMSTTAIAMVDGRRMVLSHGHIFNEDSLPPGADIFLYGHTHIPVARILRGIRRRDSLCQETIGRRDHDVDRHCPVKSSVTTTSSPACAMSTPPPESRMIWPTMGSPSPDPPSLRPWSPRAHGSKRSG